MTDDGQAPARGMSRDERLEETIPDPQTMVPLTGKPGSGRRVDDQAFVQRIDAMIEECGGDVGTFEGKLIRDQITTSLKLIYDKRGTGELKLLTAAFKELRYAYQVFERYEEQPRISIFGSARTAEDHPDFESCVVFSKRMADAGWLCITGAGDGIMKAGHLGPGAASSFGLSIRLPFEQSTNSVIAGNEKLINFRYFFTRKLMFISQCDAVAVYPGGFGTQDELFEALTLVQTGRSGIVPIVLLEHEGGDYWKHWENYVRRSLLGYKMISPEDLNLFHVTRSVDDAVEHVQRFYRNYHSSRYVKNDLVIRLRKPLQAGDVDRLNEEFRSLVKTGKIVQRGAYDIETECRDLPRLAFTHTKHGFGLLRRMIDRINEFDTANDTSLHPSEIY
ncbi:MAG: LOG family protein [Phycisphaerales bacterium]|nr:LOG family protein [Phycisphaerales bacterium]